MSLTLSKKPDWKEVLNAKARLVHQQIASLQLWVEKAGGGEKMLENLTAPYYELLHSIYAEDFPLASPAINEGKMLSAPKSKALTRSLAPKTKFKFDDQSGRKNKAMPKKQIEKGARLRKKTPSVI